MRRNWKAAENPLDAPGKLAEAAGGTPAHLTEERFYNSRDALQSEIGTALVTLVQEALDDDKVVLDPHAFSDKIAMLLKTYIETNPEAVLQAFDTVLAELKQSLPKLEAAKQKRNRRY